MALEVDLAALTKHDENTDPFWIISKSSQDTCTLLDFWRTIDLMA